MKNRRICCAKFCIPYEIKGLFRKTQLNKKKVQALQNTLEEQRDSVPNKKVINMSPKTKN